MALASAVKGAKRPSLSVVWTDVDGDVVNLTGATLTGTIKNVVNKAERSIDGTLVVTDAEKGIFLWNFGTGDVATAGTYEVQFNAAFVSGPTPGKSISAIWEVI